jgi:hypothetical protein
MDISFGSVHHLFALIKSHGGVENHLTLFFCSLDEFRIRITLAFGTVRAENGQQYESGD